MAEFSWWENALCAAFSVAGTVLAFWWMSWSARRRVTRDLQKHGCQWQTWEELDAEIRSNRGQDDA